MSTLSADRVTTKRRGLGPQFVGDGGLSAVVLSVHRVELHLVP